MKCILLCAGYATRLFPLTENFPKALLEIEEGKPLLDYIIDEVNTIDEIDSIYIVTNDRYAKHFDTWASAKNNEKPITVLNDHTTNNDNRLGGVGDLNYTIEQANIDEDIIVIAGDNLFTYKLIDLMNYYKQVKAPVAVTKELDDINLLRRFAVAKCDENDRIIDLVEKPANPESNLGVYATYIYPKEILKAVKTYLNEGNNPDAPGYFLEYVVKNYPTYAFKFHGECYDVGTHESLDQVRKLYKNMGI
jgi:glucose-1-phosphate thymidylyltransferase